jgi:protein TonB
MIFRKKIGCFCVLALAATLLVSCAAPVVHTSTQPVVVFQARPQYPFEMRHAGIAGEVTVGFIVDTDGNAREVSVVKSSRKEFEQSALICVSKWKFKPGTVDGLPVYVRMQVPIIYSLDAN